MKRRRGSRHDYLAVSDRSGFTFPASEMVTQWDGQFVHKTEVEDRNPQEFVRARRDPEPLMTVRPQNPSEPYCPVKYRRIPGGGLFDNWPPGSLGASQFRFAIAASAADPNGMSIGCTFQVYPD